MSLDKALKGIEYRQEVRGTNIYFDDWKAVPAGVREFNSGVQFRVKPQWKAIVTKPDGESKTFVDEADMWVELKLYSKNVKQFTVTYVDDPGFDYEGRKIQFRTLLGRNIWTAWCMVDNFNQLPETKTIQFRVRPDYMYKVNTSVGISYASQAFDDVDALLEHVNRMVREDTVSTFSMNRVPYVG